MAVWAHVFCTVKNEAAVNIYICAPAFISLGFVLVYKWYCFGMLKNMS